MSREAFNERERNRLEAELVKALASAQLDLRLNMNIYILAELARKFLEAMVLARIDNERAEQQRKIKYTPSRKPLP